MGSRGFVLLKFAPPNCRLFNYTRISSISSSSINYTLRNCSSNSATTNSSLEAPDVSRLAETARISLTPQQVEEFAPKIRQVVDWFGQLQAVDLSSVDPSIRADNEPDNLREDSPETFENREAIIAAIPSYEEPYIRVPKVLNKE